MILRPAAADENDDQILACHTAFAGQTDLRGMAVSAMTQFRLDPDFTRAGRPCHESPFSREPRRHRDKSFSVSLWLCDFERLSVFVHLDYNTRHYETFSIL